jgi:glutamate synthase domain-containing protein 2
MISGEVLMKRNGFLAISPSYAAGSVTSSAVPLTTPAIEALNLGAKLGGFYHDAGEAAISPYQEKHCVDLVWELGTGYFDCRTEDGKFDPDLFAKNAKSDQVKMIEIELSQGANPGHSGVLSAEKVTKEIAKIRGLEAGQDAISRSGHSAFSTPVEMLKWVAQLRELSRGKPVGIKLCVGKPHEVFVIIKALQKNEILVDFIVVDGAEGGTGAAPQEFSGHLGMPLHEGLIIVGRKRTKEAYQFRRKGQSEQRVLYRIELRHRRRSV